MKDNNRVPVTAIVLTKNEESNIARCLASLAWVDEILLVDAESTDKTVEIASASGMSWSGRIRIIKKPWSGFRNQRNFSLDEAKHDWVFVVDADEECSDDLAAKIKALLSEVGGPPCSAYKVRRVEYFLGRSIGYGIWNPSYQDRFFNREGVRYVNDVHEYPRFKCRPGRIHEPLYHSPDFAPERFLAKMNTYTSIEAMERVVQGQRTNWFRILFAFPAMFYKNYFYYGSYKDGMHGFIISVLEGVSRAVRHVKMWQYGKIINSERKG